MVTSAPYAVAGEAVGVGYHAVVCEVIKCQVKVEDT